MKSFIRGLGPQNLIVVAFPLIAVLAYVLLKDTSTYKELNAWLDSPVSSIKTSHLLFAIWFITLLTPSKK